MSVLRTHGPLVFHPAKKLRSGAIVRFSDNSSFPLIIFHSISCLLYNTKTIRDFSMKHGTLIKHDAQESLLLLSYLWSYFPLIIFQTLSCPLYNLKTVRDISMKLGTLIKQNDRICDAQEL